MRYDEAEGKKKRVVNGKNAGGEDKGGTMPKEETELNQHFAKCPFCGHEDRDSWELRDSGENTCGECEREYFYEREVVAWFTTIALPVRKDVKKVEIGKGARLYVERVYKGGEV